MSDAEKVKLLVELVEQVKEELSGFVDVDDSSDGPVANWAMRVTMDLDSALARVSR